MGGVVDGNQDAAGSNLKDTHKKSSLKYYKSFSSRPYLSGYSFVYMRKKGGNEHGTRNDGMGNGNRMVHDDILLGNNHSRNCTNGKMDFSSGTGSSKTII